MRPISLALLFLSVLVPATSYTMAQDVPRGLCRLVVDGPELHPSLVTQRFEDVDRRQLGALLRDNPYLSTDSAFVVTLARYASSGRLSGEGVRAALFAVYRDEGEGLVHLYGLEAESPADADRLEGVVRAMNGSQVRLGRARVHREGNVLVVVHRGMSPSSWEAVNAAVVERLTAR